MEEGRKLAKFWLREAELADSVNIAAHELNAIRKIVVERRDYLLERWHEHPKSTTPPAGP